MLGFESTSHVDIYCTALPTWTLAYPQCRAFTYSEQVSQGHALETLTKYIQPFCNHYLPLSSWPAKDKCTPQ